MTPTRIFVALCCLLLLSSCILLRSRSKKLFTTTDFFFYRPGFIDESGQIKFNGVYQIGNDSLVSFFRFFPDGKVVRGRCSGNVRSMTPGECFNNESKIGNYGYYLVRNDTLFLELADDGPVGSGIWFHLYELQQDTLRPIISFDGFKHKTKNFSKLPSSGQEGVSVSTGSRFFLPLDLRDSIRKNW